MGREDRGGRNGASLEGHRENSAGDSKQGKRAREPGAEAFKSKACSRGKSKYCILGDLTVCKRPRALAHLKLFLYSKNHEILKGYEIEAYIGYFSHCSPKYLTGRDLRDERFILAHGL